ncbi:hypothetical protein [Hahella ganghwensis]|uniref:hypothetical protein n=1 Tax=Hahella ganghwensis TaxID=286420 RepID=UPI00037F0027|nr:hypothetical protein [Hahella ganghwensis]
MPFDYGTAAQQTDQTSCGCCTSAWGLKSLHEQGLAAGNLVYDDNTQLPNQNNAT